MRAAPRLYLILFLLSAIILLHPLRPQSTQSTCNPAIEYCEPNIVSQETVPQSPICPNSGTSDYTATLLLSEGAISTGIASSILALIVSFDVIGIAYIISKIDPAAPVRNWLHREYWELTKSVLLVASIFSIIIFMGNLSSLLSGSPVIPGKVAFASIGNLINNADSYLCSVNSYSNGVLNKFIPLFFEEGIFNGQSPGGGIDIKYAGFPIPPASLGPELDWIPVFRNGVEFKPFSSLLLSVNIVYLGSPFQSLFNDFLMFLVFPTKLIYAAQAVILPDMVAIALALLIPAGLIMRAFPFTRGLGGTLIAFGIGAAILWPSLLVLFNKPVSDYFLTILSPQSNVQNVNTCGGWGLAAPLCSAVVNIWNSYSASNEAANVAGSTIFSIYPVMNYLLNNSYYLMLQFYILFILDMMIIFPLTDGVAKLLGGTIRLQIGGKLKLV